MIEKYIPKFLSCLYDERIKDVIPGQELIDMFHSNQINSIYEILKAADALRIQGMPTKTLYIGSWMGFKTKLFSEYFQLSITELEGHAYMGIDVNGDGSIDCGIMGDFNAKKSS